ncbi:MAG: hypothetical protein ACK5MH_10540 [Bacteroidales bacterium]
MNQYLIVINFPPDTELSKTNQTNSKTYKIESNSSEIESNYRKLTLDSTKM